MGRRGRGWCWEWGVNVFENFENGLGKEEGKGGVDLLESMIFGHSE